METKARPSTGQELLPPAEAESARPKKRRPWLVWLILLALGASGYGGFRYVQAGQRRQEAASAAQAARASRRTVPVAATSARTGDLPVYLRGLGSVAAYNTVTVKSRVDGQLVAVRFREGQFVRKGEVLAEIDPRPFQVQLQQAQGQLARDQATQAQARADLSRYQVLAQHGVIPRQQLETQTAAVEQSAGTLTADQAAIENARLQIGYARITAPISGRVGLRLVDVGNMIHASDPTGLVVIAQLQPIAVLFTIPADNLPPVLRKLNSGARLHVDAYDRDDRTRLASGYLLTLDNQIDPTTGTSRLKAVFDNADRALFPNQFVNCRLLLDTRRNAVLVPAAAIQHGPQGNYVYVVTPEHTAQMRQVTPGLTEGNQVAVDSGLAAGEMVVTDGQDKLQPGTPVSVRAGAARPPSAAGPAPAGQVVRPPQRAGPPPSVARRPGP
jgi:multidrug efflux system membrane fusion protein